LAEHRKETGDALIVIRGEFGHGHLGLRANVNTVELGNRDAGKESRIAAFERTEATSDTVGGRLAIRMMRLEGKLGCHKGQGLQPLS
jgi:hypothetical protein